LPQGLAKQIRLFDELLTRCPVGPIRQAVFEAAEGIYVGLKNRDENGIYIAAWCKTYGLTLITNNTKHFENVAGLATADWSE
jgi:predicted nucleic acid-binding protein